MPVSHRYDPKTNIVFTRPTGILALTEISTYFGEVADDPRVAPGFVEIVLFDDVEDFAFSYMQAEQILNAYRESMLAKQCVRTVFIAQTPVGYGIARMLSAVMREHADLRVVRTEDQLQQELSDIRSGEVRFDRGGKRMNEMKCSRPTCSCKAEPDRRVELGGRIYCSEKCARECTDECCTCTPCACPN
jgi:hypothetical protein